MNKECRVVSEHEGLMGKLPQGLSWERLQTVGARSVLVSPHPEVLVDSLSG